VQARFDKKRVIPPPAIYQVPVNNLDETDPIFDSLRDGYEEFDSWSIKIKRQGRDCWVHWCEDESIDPCSFSRRRKKPSIAILPSRKGDG
jgi:hypothetical protein